MIFRRRFSNIFLDFFGYIIVGTLILNCRSMWTTTPNSKFNDAVLFVLVLSVLAYLCCCGIKRRILSSYILFVLATIAYAFIFVLYNTSSAVGFIRLVIGFLSILLLCMNIDGTKRANQLLVQYKNVVYVIAIISLVFWIIGSNLGIVHPTSTILTTWTGNSNIINSVPSYYGIYFEPQRIRFLNIIKVVRNCAIFTEAPMCSFHFCIAFLIELFVETKLSLRKSVVLFLGGLSTFASLGWIVIVVAISAKIISSRPKISVVQLLRIIVIPIIIICAILVCQYLVINKLSYGTSGSTHMDDIRAGYLAWLDSPLMGYGVNYSDVVVNYMTKSVRRDGNYGLSSSLAMIMTYGGAYLLLPYLFIITKTISRLLRNKDFSLICMYFLFLLLFMFTLIPVQYLTWFLLGAFYILSRHKKTDVCS